MNRAQAVLFDLDGTLVDTPTGIVTILAGMFPDRAREQLTAVVGRPLALLLADLSGHRADSEQVSELARDFRHRFSRDVIPHAHDLVFDGVTAMLTDLRVRKVPVAVVTSKSPRGAQEMLDAAALGDYVDVVVGYTDSLPGKPAPDQALAAAAALGVTPAACLVVGDSTDDMAMARAAGMRAYGVGYGVHTPAVLIDAGAHLVLPTAKDLARAVTAGTTATESDVA